MTNCLLNTSAETAFKTVSASACVDIYLSSRHVAMQVFSAQQSLTSVFGMGTGGPSALITSTFYAPSGIRTRDPLIKSQLLYQLS